MVKSFLGLEVDFKHVPELDPDFIPLSEVFRAYEKKLGEGGVPVGLGVQRSNGDVNVIRFKIEKDSLTETDKYIASKLLKSMLWIYGGNMIFVGGGDELADFVSETYGKDGKRVFDWAFMSKVYEMPFEVKNVSYKDLPKEETYGQSNLCKKKEIRGCLIGFDAGGSDIKISSIIDGQVVFSKEIIWHPKINQDPDYHYKHIVDALKLAASKMPRIDGIGISSAGIYINNQVMAASLFIQVPENVFLEKKVKDIYIEAAKEIGDVPLVVANDGDVTALAGAMEYDSGEVLGIAMGTSQAGGYVGASGEINGWLNELAFVPIDANPNGTLDEWSLDVGCGVKYLSQDGIIKLAPAAGIVLNGSSPAEKLAIIQGLMDCGDLRAKKIYESLGVYLGYAIAYYERFYKISHLLLMGRVVSGDGGVIIMNSARRVLKSEYPTLAENITIHLPNEISRRIGQSIAAASLPNI